MALTLWELFLKKKKTHTITKKKKKNNGRKEKVETWTTMVSEFMVQCNINSLKVPQLDI